MHRPTLIQLPAPAAPCFRLLGCGPGDRPAAPSTVYVVTQTWNFLLRLLTRGDTSPKQMMTQLVTSGLGLGLGMYICTSIPFFHLACESVGSLADFVHTQTWQLYHTRSSDNRQARYVRMRAQSPPSQGPPSLCLGSQSTPVAFGPV